MTRPLRRLQLAALLPSISDDCAAQPPSRRSFPLASPRRRAGNTREGNNSPWRPLLYLGQSETVQARRNQAACPAGERPTSKFGPASACSPESPDHQTRHKDGRRRCDHCFSCVRSHYPVVGHDAFRTGTGVHAAAIIKARRKGNDWLADRIYSSVPAGAFGFRQRIDISPVSGLSNVKCWLEEHGYDRNDGDLCGRLFDAAKRADRTLTDDECHAIAGAG